MDDDYKIKPLHIMLLKTSAYVKNYDHKTKWMFFLIEDDIWNKVSHSIKKNLIRNSSKTKNL